jgi:hypothetical protein
MAAGLESIFEILEVQFFFEGRGDNFEAFFMCFKRVALFERGLIQMFVSEFLGDELGAAGSARLGTEGEGVDGGQVGKQQFWKFAFMLSEFAVKH